MGGAAVRGGRRVAWSPEAPGGARSVRGGRSAQLYTRLAQTQCRGEYGVPQGRSPLCAERTSLV